MVTISGNFAQDICTINNNKIVGSIKLLNSKISFNGKNNIFISKNATLTNSNIEFRGNNSIIYLNKSNLRINFFCGHHSNIYVGKKYHNIKHFNCTLCRINEFNYWRRLHVFV